MKLRSNMGGFVTVNDEKRARRLVESGSWTLAENDSDESAERSDTDNGTETPENPSQAPSEPSGPQNDGRPDVSDVRAWARENNIEVSDKGRVPAEVYAKYAEAQKNN